MRDKECKVARRTYLIGSQRPWGTHAPRHIATTRLNRKAFELKWNQVLETGGVVVGNELSVTIDVEFVEKNQGTLIVP
jgi:polyisoprenoid-binding protein YceI